MESCKYGHHRVHTKERYLERFNHILSDDDYNELCSLSSKENAIRISTNKYRSVILFKEKYIWCIFNRHNNIITLYPLGKKDILSYINDKIDYSNISLIYKERNDRKKLLKKTKKLTSSSES